MNVRRVSMNQDLARIRRRYEKMASGELVSALVHDRLSEENARIAREILWQREERDQSLRSEQRKLRRRLKRDKAKNGSGHVGAHAGDTGQSRAGVLGVPWWAWWWLAMAIVVVVSMGLLI